MEKLGFCRERPQLVGPRLNHIITVAVTEYELVAVAGALTSDHLWLFMGYTSRSLIGYDNL